MEQTLPYFELISHPDRTLKEHLYSCNKISEKLLEMKYISDNWFTKNEIEQLRKLLVYFHDFGKATDYFQHKIIEATFEEDNECFIKKNLPYLNYFKETRSPVVAKDFDFEILSSHARLGAYYVFSNYSNKNSVVEYIIFEIIKRHHGYLRNFISNKTEVLLDRKDVAFIEKQLKHLNFSSYDKILKHHQYNVSETNWVKIKKRFTDVVEVDDIKQSLIDEVKRDKKQAIKYFFLQHYLFSLLLSADKGDMMLNKEHNRWTIKENQLFDLRMIDFYKNITLKKGEKAIDIDREDAYQQIAINVKKHSGNNFFSITLPTGMGKTFSAYNAAIILQNEFIKNSDGKKPRIIYCLPFTSIIDQNSAIITDVVERFGNGFTPDMIAKHHHLSNYNETYNKNEIDISEAEYLTEGWEQEFIVTTFVQFLESIFTNQNRALRKFHNMTNAIIVLDEVQNIPPKYYEAIELVFTKMAEYFNTKFVFVTATQPVLFAKTKIIELTDVTGERTKYFFEKLERIVIDQQILKQSNYQPQDLETELLPIFCKDVEGNGDKSFLFIFNTIAQAQFVYNRFCELYENENQIIYLSGSILPKRRKQLIQLIKRNIKYNKRQLIVSTQVVEAGVDIDLDIVYRDFAPLDSINQSAGRCNRNGTKGKGVVKLFNTGKHSRIYDSTLINITISIFKKLADCIPEKEIYTLSNNYFKGVWESISNGSNSSETLIKAIYHLELETIQKEFKLIKDEDYYYNVFIPYNQESQKLWRFYCEINTFDDFFARKQKMKKIKARLLQYVTRFPKNKYHLDPSKKDNYILNVEDWKEYYDLNSGFKLNQNEVNLMFL
jgi:CRISPR-associated endonuclease/helicase Cas3